MAYEIIYTIIKEMVEYDRKDEMKQMWEIRNHFWDTIDWDTRVAPLKDWLNETLDLLGVPEGVFRKMYVDGLFKDSNKVHFLMQYIRDICEPDEDEE